MNQILQSYLVNNNNNFLVSPNNIGSITIATLNTQISTIVSSLIGDLPTILDVNNNTLCISTIIPCPYDNKQITISSPITIIDSTECKIGLQYNSITTINALSIVQRINTPQINVNNNLSANTAVISSLTVSSINNISYTTMIHNNVTYITSQTVTYTINDLQQGNIYMNLFDNNPINTVITVNLPILPTDGSLDGYLFTFRKLRGGINQTTPNWIFNGSIIPVDNTLNGVQNTYNVNSFNIQYIIVTYNSIGYYIAIT